ncbi:mucosal addressin cell adhesion molecule 1 [Erythrolamprus reginae]|uniref:mucosal addressin cell adhesion molecule 1 n=1 Tax=Erythrolamprus reginae TaxID=121349 RepID=UPI00396C2E00
MAIISLLFLFSLVCYSCSFPTSKPVIRPQKPLVERGGTIQLICSMDCPDAEVQWEGLDTDLGDIISNHTHSILTLSNATIDAAGTKMCSGRCQETSFPARVELNVYSFPDTLQLDSQPERLTVRQPARLLCSMSHIYPHGALTLSWFRGDEQLEASKETEEEEMRDSEEEQLFVYRSELELPRVAEGIAYKCKATLEVEGEIFIREKVAIAVASPKSTQEPLRATESIALNPTSVRESQTSALELLTTADWKSSAGTTSSLLHLVSTEHRIPRTSVVTPTADPTLESLTEDHNSITVVSSSTGSSSPTDPELTEKPLATTEGITEKPTTTDGFSTEGTTRKPKDPCRPTIVPVPAQGVMGGALRITCQTAKCSPDIEIQWVETPMAQSRVPSGGSRGPVDPDGRERQLGAPGGLSMRCDCQPTPNSNLAGCGVC